MTSRLYFLSVKVNMCEQGFDLPGTLEKIRVLLSDYSSSTKCIHKFKVTGESKIVAVFEVSNVVGLERTVSGLARLGNIDVTCKPIRPYENFANMLKVDEELTKPSTNCIKDDKDCQMFWLDFTVEYPGKNTDELLATWHREATFALTARKGGVHIELFKNVGERKVQAFIVMEPDDLDELSFNLPVVKENGNGVNISVHAIQSLDDYCSSMSSQASAKPK
ncbi:uncharacterized protein LOC132751057 isoform X2 [Ruditapes philippinarum]|nr:uncharacterized protein LOC132751057 isoform X2 [Ruditapes philippinarum]XP_060597147.1 uncharacterized protein LOC132751057 isoform X2 [Ruditapes philippinarum]